MLIDSKPRVTLVITSSFSCSTTQTATSIVNYLVRHLVLLTGHLVLQVGASLMDEETLGLAKAGVQSERAGHDCTFDNILRGVSS